MATSGCWPAGGQTNEERKDSASANQRAAWLPSDSGASDPKTTKEIISNNNNKDFFFLIINLNLPSDWFDDSRLPSCPSLLIIKDIFHLEGIKMIQIREIYEKYP